MQENWRDDTYSHNSSLMVPQRVTELEVARKIDRVKKSTNCSPQEQNKQHSDNLEKENFIKLIKKIVFFFFFTRAMLDTPYNL